MRSSKRCTLRPLTSRRQRGITLGEVLFVALLVLIGTGVLWFVAKRTQTDTRLHDCATNVRQLGSALLMYSYDHDSTLPPYTNLEKDLAKRTRDSSLPTSSNDPQLLRACLKLYSGDDYWFCPTDEFSEKKVYALGVRHEFTSYAFPAHLDNSGHPLKLSKLQINLDTGLVWDAAGDRSSCQEDTWRGGGKAFASNHPDGSVNVVLADLSLRHLSAMGKDGSILP